MFKQIVSGWLLVDKPEGISSADAVNKLKKFFKPSKIGHAGTLDPFASGMLVVAIGEATKLIDHAMDQEKIYQFVIKWGESTDTLDCTGSVVNSSLEVPTLEQLQAVILSFGNNTIIEQVPPNYSALHVNGRRAYDMARAGEEFSLPAREVFLREIKILEHNIESTVFEVTSGKGFYVRSLARDIADRLRVCGHVAILRRIKVGKFTQSDSIKLDYLLQLLHNADRPEMLLDFLRPVGAMLDDILVLHVTEEEIKLLRQGRRVHKMLANYDIGQKVIACDLAGNKVIAICSMTENGLIPKRVINNY